MLRIPATADVRQAARGNDSMTDVDSAARFAAHIAPELDDAYRLAGVILGDAAAAEDAVHDAAIKAWRHFGSLRDQASFGAWFGRILVNVCRDRLREARRHPVVDLSASVAADTGEHAVPDASARIARKHVVEQALRRLAPEQLIVIVLRYEMDMTVPAIAHQLGVPEGTVKSRLNAARERLRTALRPEGPL